MTDEDPDEYLRRVLGDTFWQACVAMGEHGAVRETVRGFRPPKPRAVVTIDSKKVRGGFQARPESVSTKLWAWKAECAVYAHESADPRGPSQTRTGRLVVAVAHWPERGLSALRVASLRTDGTLEEADAGELGIREALTDVPWLRAIRPAKPARPAPPERSERRRLTQRALVSGLVLGITLTFVLLSDRPRLWEGPAAAYFFGTRVTVERPAPCTSKWVGTSGHGHFEAICRAEWKTADGAAGAGTVIADGDNVSKPEPGRWLFTGEARAYGEWAYAPVTTTPVVVTLVVASLLLISLVAFLRYAVLALTLESRTVFPSARRPS
ncbi:hypothetical protein [Streptomyces sp. NPDC001678]|uniref:hypothetical protein n=1 Tax=Streptomyces sp. NPDC001678 TaxID=3364599 RepID=UPI00368FDA82